MCYEILLISMYILLIYIHKHPKFRQAPDYSMKIDLLKGTDSQTLGLTKIHGLVGVKVPIKSFKHVFIKEEKYCSSGY